MSVPNRKLYPDRIGAEVVARGAGSVQGRGGGERGWLLCFFFYGARFSNEAGSDPTVGVALFGRNVSDQSNSFSEELPVRMKKYSEIVSGLLAHPSAGRVARTNLFQVFYRVIY